MAKKPGKLNYDLDKTPRNYKCGVCGAKGVKLWRDYQTFLDNQTLRCTDCALKYRDEGKGGDPENKGKPWDGESTSIGWCVAAVPTEDGKTYWGYSSVPSRGVCWWWRLEPQRKVMEPKPEPKPEPHNGPKPEDVEYLVEATHEEQHALWARWHQALNWKQGHGYSQTIGYGRGLNRKKLPVHVVVWYVWVDGHLLGFWEVTSILADYEAAEAWVRKTFKNAKGNVNAANFHNALHSIDINKEWTTVRCRACDSWTTIPKDKLKKQLIDDICDKIGQVCEGNPKARAQVQSAVVGMLERG